ncbi:hypothetical protein [Bauldia sp.]|uniref:hypothetical protein n=1 Tax=Bauldia sp. TaxID=2575872 RepID=UPI003BACBCFC
MFSRAVLPAITCVIGVVAASSASADWIPMPVGATSDWLAEDGRSLISASSFGNADGSIVITTHWTWGDDMVRCIDRISADLEETESRCFTHE